MKLLSALIAVFIVSGAVAQKAPSYSCTSTGHTYSNLMGSDRSQVSQPGQFIFRCKDPKTGRIEKVKCKKPLKQIMPPKDRPTVMTMAKLKKACGLLDGLEDIDTNG